MVIPGTLSVFKPISEIILAKFRPCSASGVAFPTIMSSILLVSSSGKSFNKCWTTCLPISSGLVNLKTPLPDFPTADLYPPTIYAVFITYDY